MIETVAVVALAVAGALSFAAASWAVLAVTRALTLVSRQSQHTQREDRVLIGKLMDQVISLETEHKNATAQGVAELRKATENLAYIAQAGHNRQSEPPYGYAVADQSEE